MIAFSYQRALISSACPSGTPCKPSRAHGRFRSKPRRDGRTQHQRNLPRVRAAPPVGRLAAGCSAVVVGLRRIAPGVLRVRVEAASDFVEGRLTWTMRRGGPMAWWAAGSRGGGYLAGAGGLQLLVGPERLVVVVVSSAGCI